MSTEELKLIIELFQGVTEGAIIGGIGWMVMSLLQTLIPWCIGGWLGSKLISRLPKVKIKDTEDRSSLPYG